MDWGAYCDTAAREMRALLEAKLQDRDTEAVDPAAALLPLLQALRQGVAAAQKAGPTRSPVPSRPSRRPGRRTV